MSSAASVAAVGAASRSSAAHAVTSAVTTVNLAHSVNNKHSAQSPVSLQAAQSITSSGSVASQLPVGLLLSVSPPPASNAVASSDYVDMQNALRTSNLTAAQQAYMRLQSDLVLDDIQGVVTSSPSHVLDAVA